MKYLGEFLAFLFLFLFSVFLVPTLIEKTVGVAGFGSEYAIIQYLAYIVLGSLTALFGIQIYRSRN